MKNWFVQQIKATKAYFRCEDSQRWPPTLLTALAALACIAVIMLPDFVIVPVMLAWFGLLFWSLSGR